jgi:hypothetical protein
MKDMSKLIASIGFVVVVFLVCGIAFGICSCGKTAVLTGTFDVGLELMQDTCDSSATGQMVKQVWTIEKKTDYYTLSVTDEQEATMLIAMSDDGHTFFGQAQVKMFECTFVIDWAMDIDYEGSGFTGTSVSRLTAGCTTNECAERWNATGIRR